MLRKLLIATCLALSSLAGDATAPTLARELEPLRPFLGVWKGNFIGGKSTTPMFDVTRFERALNGQAIRVLHSVNDGIYGGETLIVWNAQNKRIEYHYFTTDGDRTEGVMEISKEGSIVSNEKVKGDDSKENAVTEVRATSKLLPGGGLHVKAEYLKKTGWVPGHEIRYTNAPSAQVVFK